MTPQPCPVLSPPIAGTPLACHRNAGHKGWHRDADAVVAWDDTAPPSRCHRCGARYAVDVAGLVRCQGCRWVAVAGRVVTDPKW